MNDERRRNPRRGPDRRWSPGRRSDDAGRLEAYKALVREALAFEKAGRWSDATELWSAIKTMAQASPQTTETRGNLKPGDILVHMCRGKILATCEYRADDDWRYNGQSYPSASTAGNAAARDLGQASAKVNGWVFWGIDSIS